MRKSWQILGIAVLLMASLFVAACGPKTIATVNGKKITQTDYDKRFEQLKLSAQQSGATFNGEAGNYMLAGLEREALDRLEQEIMIMDAAKKEKIDVSDAEVNKFVKERKAQTFKTEKDYQDFLKKNGLTDKDLIWTIKYQLTGQKLFDSLTKNVTVSDSDLKPYFEQNQQQFKPRVKVSHILIKAEEGFAEKTVIDKAQLKAEDIIKQLDAGADFKKLAGQYSDDPGTKDKGGYFDQLFAADEQNIDTDFVKASFTLKKVGDITQQPVKSRFGFHIIKLEEKLDNPKAMEPEIKMAAIQAKKNQVFQVYLNKLKKDAKIKEDFKSKYENGTWKKNQQPQKQQQPKAGGAASPHMGGTTVSPQQGGSTNPHQNVNPRPTMP